MSEGYFSEKVIPEELGLTQNEQAIQKRVLELEGKSWFYCRPVGTHPAMTEVVLARAREIVQQFPFPRAPKPASITLFIAGHGTEQNENSRRVVEDQVARIRALNLYADVQPIFLEEEPRIGSCYQLAQSPNLVVVPFFASDGLHVQEDIPVELGEPKRIVQERLQAGKSTWRNPTEKHGKLVWYTPSVGTAPSVSQVILERVREAVGS